MDRDPLLETRPLSFSRYALSDQAAQTGAARAPAQQGGASRLAIRHRRDGKVRVLNVLLVLLV
jgi:hypothetical protein